MLYSDGNMSMVGDLIQIDGYYKGRVVANIDTESHCPGHEDWSYLGEGIMVDTDFGGLIHYTQEATDELVLLSRAPAL